MRIILQYVLPFLLPMLVFWLWLYLAKRERPSWAEGPWFWLILAGFLLTALSLGYFGTNQGSAPGGTYVPQRYQDGEILPSEIN